MIRILSNVFVFILTASLPPTVHAAKQSWSGRYIYEANYGRTAGGTAVTARYTIVIDGKAPGKAILTVDGYQSDETLICDTRADANTMTLSFRSYEDGNATNVYGVAVYKPGTALLRLERREGNARSSIVTHWLELTGLDGKKPAAGVYFRRKR